MLARLRNWGSLGGGLLLMLAFSSAPSLAQTGQVSGDDDAVVLPIGLGSCMNSPSSVPSQITPDYLVELASQNHPDIAAAQARIAVAQGRMVQAGLYPNPVVGPRTDEWGPKDRGGHPGATITQEFVTAGKLRLARTAASYGVQ